MSKNEPEIQKYMTCVPESVQKGDLVKVALGLMQEKGIHHIPVLDGEHIYGLLSTSDIETVQAVDSADLNSLQVSDICKSHPYTVLPDTPLHEVADEMSKHHYSSALVAQNNKLVGIFTTVDVCRALSSILELRFHSK